MANEPKMKPVRLKTADHKRVNDLRYKLMELRGADVSLAQTVMESVKLMEDKVEADK